MSALQNSNTELDVLEQTQLVDQSFSSKLHVPATDFAEECPVTLTMPTHQWENWKTDQERRFACKFHDQTPKYTYRRKTTGTGGRPQTNIFYRVFRCHRRGHYTSQAKQRKAATSIRCGCEAMFTVTCKKVTPEVVQIKYHWRHTGHQPGTPSDLAKTPIDKEAREWIRQRVEEGMDWRGIKQLLKTEQEIMFKIMNEENIAIPSKLRIGYQDVYYAIRQHNRKLKEDASQGSDKFDPVGQAQSLDNGEGSSHMQEQDRKQELPVITESSIRSSLPASAAASVPTNAPIVSDATSQFLNDVLQAARQEAEAANQAKLK
ncbi:hypothetical protein INT44_001073 [Umbelopsis vinacea]|uniref:Uncharacterized protein n=1 Tax=Umbelopsis vinacea TaxID=44442 RepID=A0A8H7QA42_9FUNG|nr:hypothetical protein INT44_001073 [Umbelopsis vinacea]